MPLDGRSTYDPRGPGFISVSLVLPPMARYRRWTRIRAPLDAVWSFHSRIDGLTAVTPAWLGLRVEWVRGPDGRRDPDGLQLGTTVGLSMRPFGIGPRQHWTSGIVGRERRDEAAWFRDEMVEGPFPRWEHTHRLVATDSGTILADYVEYDLPHVPGALAWIGRPGFELVFADRQRRTRALLEAGTA